MFHFGLILFENLTKWQGKPLIQVLPDVDIKGLNHTPELNVEITLAVQFPLSYPNQTPDFCVWLVAQKGLSKARGSTQGLTKTGAQTMAKDSAQVRFEFWVWGNLPWLSNSSKSSQTPGLTWPHVQNQTRRTFLGCLEFDLSASPFLACSKSVDYLLKRWRIGGMHKHTGS